MMSALRGQRSILGVPNSRVREMEWYLLGKRVSDASPDRILIMRRGASFTIPLNSSSRYDGLTFYYQKGIHVNPVKILDRIDIDETSSLEQVHVKANETIFVYESGLIIRYSLKCAKNKSKSINALVIHSNRPITGTVWLDTRHPYDAGNFHKTYDIKEINEVPKRKNYSKNHSYSIRFAKRGEHDSRYDMDYSFKMLFESANDNAAVERVEWWHPFHDEYDKSRGERVHEHYSYAPFRFIDQHRIILSEDSPSSFIESAPETAIISGNINDNSGTLISMLSHHIKSSMLESGAKNKSYAMISGYPWFFQSWTRDTALSIHSLRLTGNEDEYRGMLLYVLRHLERDKASIPHGELKSIDAPLIAIMRLHQAYSQLSSGQKSAARKTAMKIIRRIQSENVRDELLWSNSLETWMDTGDIEFRKGACIEMQALLHRSYLFMEQTETMKRKKRSTRSLQNC
jgi:glycogen debranching enzyme